MYTRYGPNFIKCINISKHTDSKKKDEKEIKRNLSLPQNGKIMHAIYLFVYYLFIFAFMCLEMFTVKDKT